MTPQQNADELLRLWQENRHLPPAERLKPRKAYRTGHNARAIVEAYAVGEKISIIAEIHDIDKSTVLRIVRRHDAVRRLTGRPRNPDCSAPMQPPSAAMSPAPVIGPLEPGKPCGSVTAKP